MDWVKLKAEKVLLDYSYLSDKEFKGFISLCALYSILERIPDKRQILKHVHHKTLMSLIDKFNGFENLFVDIAEEVRKSVNARSKARSRKRQERQRLSTKTQNVTRDVFEVQNSDMSHNIEEMEDVCKNRNPDYERVLFYVKSNFDLSEKDTEYYAKNFYERNKARGWMDGKNPILDFRPAFNCYYLNKVRYSVFEKRSKSLNEIFSEGKGEK